MNKCIAVSVHVMYNVYCCGLPVMLHPLNQHFHEAAYSALMSDDLLDAIDEFLDDSIVLPPGDWDENLLLPMMHQRNDMRKRKGERVRDGGRVRGRVKK